MKAEAMNKTGLSNAIVARRAGELCDQGYHCSESVIIAVGEHLFGSLDEQAIKMSSGFAGGVGGGHNELCGALSAGVMLIGALYGRAHFEQNDDFCLELAQKYRTYFVSELGSSNCEILRAENEARGRKSCSVLVEQASLKLLSLLQEAERSEKQQPKLSR